MPSVITIVGHSNSGKTTLIEKLIPELKRRGYRIGTIKHTSRGFSMDHPGKDTDRHRKAGADTVMAASPGMIAMVKSTDHDDLESLLPWFQDVDIVLVEGFKNENQSKIEVVRLQIGQSPLFPEDPMLAAIVTDSPLNVKTPVYHCDAIPAICDMIEKNRPAWSRPALSGQYRQNGTSS